MENHIQDLMDDWRTAKNRVKVAEQKEFGVRMDIRQAIAALLPLSVNVGAIEIGHWACDYSHIGICVYDDWSDPIHDNCLYCNEPEERK